MKTNTNLDDKIIINEYYHPQSAQYIKEKLAIKYIKENNSKEKLIKFLDSHNFTVDFINTRNQKIFKTKGVSNERN